MDPIQYISEKIDDVPMISVRSLAHELLINIREARDALEKFIKSSNSKDVDVCYIVTGIKKSSQENNFSETCGMIETSSQYVQEKDIDKITKLLLPDFRKSIYAIRKKAEGPFGIGKFHQRMTIDSTDHLKTLGYIFNSEVHKIKALDRNQIPETKTNISTSIKPKMEASYSLPSKGNDSKATSEISSRQKINTEPIQTPKPQGSEFASQIKKPSENSTQPSTIKENISKKKGIMGFFTKKESGSHGNLSKDSPENITPKNELEARACFPLEDASRQDLNNNTKVRYDNQTSHINLKPKVEGDANVDVEEDVDSEEDLIDIIDTTDKKTRGKNLESIKKKGSKETKKKAETLNKRKNNITESKRETLTSKNKKKGPKKEDEVDSLNIPSDDDDDFMSYRPKMNNKLLALDDSEDEEQSSLNNFSQPSSPIHEVNNKPISSFLQAKPESKPQYIVGSDGKKRKRLVTKEKVKKMIGKKLVVEFQDVSEYVTEEEEETPKPSQGILKSSIESKIDVPKSLKEFKQETKTKTKQSDITNFFKPKKN